MCNQLRTEYTLSSRICGIRSQLRSLSFSLGLFLKGQKLVIFIFNNFYHGIVLSLTLFSNTSQTQTVVCSFKDRVTKKNSQFRIKKRKIIVVNIQIHIQTSGTLVWYKRFQAYKTINKLSSGERIQLNQEKQIIPNKHTQGNSSNI